MDPLPPTAHPNPRPRPWWQRLPLLTYSLAFLLGVALGPQAPLPWTVALSGAVGLFALQALARRWFRPGPWLALAATLLLGLARFRADLPDLHSPQHIAAYRDTGRQVVVVGVLTADPEPRGKQALLWVQSERLRFADEGQHHAVHGLLLARVSWNRGRTLRYGDQVVLRGQLRTPPDGHGSAYRAYLARQGVYALLDAKRVGVLEHDQGHPIMAALLALRRRALREVFRLWPQPEAGLLAGILLGDDRRIPRDLYRAFRDTGTAHIIAISGFNMTLIAGITVALLGRALGPLWGSLAAAGALAAYTALVGADAAVVRAALMGGLALLARRVARTSHPYTALAATAALMAAFHPQILWDIGFQLSFAATWGLMRFADPLAQGAQRVLTPLLGPRLAQRLTPTLSDAFLLTLAAQATTFPIAAVHFHRVSLVALLANPLILLAQAPLMILGGLALMAALIWEPLGRGIGFLAWPWVAYTIHAVQGAARFPWSAMTLTTFGAFHALGYYLLLGGLPHLLRLRTSLSGMTHRQTIKRLPVLIGAVLLAALLAREVLAGPDGRLHLWLLDTHGGETWLLRTPNGHFILLNGGADLLTTQEAVGRRMPLGRTTLDALVIASADVDNLRGLDDLVTRYAPAGIWWPWEGVPPGPALSELAAQLEALGRQAETLSPGGQLVLDTDLTLQVIQTQPQGAVLLLRYGDFIALLPFTPWDAALVEHRISPPTVLLLAGHGRAKWNDLAWIQAHPPQALLLAVDPHAQPDLPAPQVVQSLAAWPLLRTDLHGTIHLVTDGTHLWVTVER